jgi:predicted short-subunit dehydrogenase-like oxidoreductase (DUF2520 family)
LISISDPKAGADRFREIWFALEGDAAAVGAAQRLVKGLGARHFRITASKKALYHAAALMASPNLTALFDIALQMLVRCGLSETRARNVLLPLVKSTLDNLTQQDPARALTGTFKRGDVATVRKHLSAIESQDLSEALRAYVVLGCHSIDLAGLKGTSRSEIQRLLRVTLKRLPENS